MHLALLRPDGDNGTASAPISADGYAESGKRYQLPARQGRAVRLRPGDQLTIINDSGTQVCDFFALTEGNPGAFLSMEHCRTALGRIYVRAGDSLVTNRRQPVLKIVEDTSPGVHDTLIAACDLPRYRQLGAEGYHDNCADNFQNALLAIGVSAPHVPCPFNIWMNIAVTPGGSYEWAAPVSRAGDRIVLRALEACIAVMSACPQDMTAVNGASQTPTGLTFSVEQQPR
ncbi:MAG: urea carboxylase-associated family protein [Rhizobiales bacterium]|nr:urea carboxylase-associated family protein [Hyphomicrobiales bacterium]